LYLTSFYIYKTHDIIKYQKQSTPKSTPITAIQENSQNVTGERNTPLWFKHNKDRTT